MNHPELFNLKSIQALRLIKDAHHIILLAHQKPDPDALGSCATLSLLCRSLGKTTEIVYPGIGRDSYPFPIADLNENNHTQAPDLIISCDTPVLSRLYFPPEFASLPHINIDHHQGNTIPATLSFVETTSTSTCELVYRILQCINMPLTPLMANQLLFGILCDTLNFRVSGTTPASLRIAADLIDQGANIHQLSQHMILHSNPAVLNLWGTLLSNARYNKNKTALWIVCSNATLAQFNLTDEALNGFIAMISQTMQTDIIIFFYEYNGKSKASLRSKKTDVNAIARQCGGGGHIHASGITSDLPLEELVSQVSALCS